MRRCLHNPAAQEYSDAVRPAHRHEKWAPVPCFVTGVRVNGRASQSSPDETQKRVRTRATLRSMRWLHKCLKPGEQQICARLVKRRRSGERDAVFKEKSIPFSEMDACGRSHMTKWEKARLACKARRTRRAAQNTKMHVAKASAEMPQGLVEAGSVPKKHTTSHLHPSAFHLRYPSIRSPDSLSSIHPQHIGPFLLFSTSSLSTIASLLHCPSLRR